MPNKAVDWQHLVAELEQLAQDVPLVVDVVEQFIAGLKGNGAKTATRQAGCCDEMKTCACKMLEVAVCNLCCAVKMHKHCCCDQDKCSGG